MDKAPDAFRTISEVADDLDIPQHVLRFWETRFSQIRPMKRSGGRRYYRPDDVDLLKGIRHLLYGQGYTIRGVQRILKEQGLKSVQGLAEESAGLPDAAPARTMTAAVDDAPDELTGDAGTPPDIAEHNEDARIVAPPQPVRAEPSFQMATATRTAAPSAYAPAGSPAPPVPVSDAARVRLQGALQDLLTCRQLLDTAARRS